MTKEVTRSLIQAVDGPHSALDVDATNVLPVLLQQGDKEVDGELDVQDDFVKGQINVGNSDTQAQNLLHLELDSGLDFQDLLLHGLVVSNQGRELASLVQSGTQKTRNLTNDGLRGKESIIFVSY